MHKVKRDVEADGQDGSVDVYLDLQEVGSWAALEQALLAVDSLLVYLKVLHFLAGVPYIATLLQTLGRAQSQLTWFLVCLAVLLLAFATSFHLAMGSTMSGYRDLGSSMMSLLHFTLGEVDISALHRDNPAVGPLLYVTFVFLVIFVAVSIFLAIVTDAYAAEKREAVDVDLGLVLRDATRRQIWRTVHMLRVAHARVHDCLVRLRMRGQAVSHSFQRAAASFTRKRQAHDQRAESLNSQSSGDSAHRRLKARTLAEALAVEAEEAAQAERAAAAEAERLLNELSDTRGAMEGGHLFILNGVSTQLKSMCFRQDTRDPQVRTPMQMALVELDRLRALNEALKGRAREDGWEWHLGSGQLLPAAHAGREGGAHAHALAHASTAGGIETATGAAGDITEGKTASDAPSSRTGNAMAAIVRARQLARGFKARLFDGGGTAATNSDNEDGERDLATRRVERGMLIETGDGKLKEVHSPGVTSPTTRKRHRRKKHHSRSPPGA